MNDNITNKIKYTQNEKNKLEKIYDKYKIKSKLIIERVQEKQQDI